MRQHLKDLKGYRTLLRGNPVSVRLLDFKPALKFSRVIKGTTTLKGPDMAKLKAGMGNTSSWDEVIETKNKLEEYIYDLEDDLQTVGDDAQLANVERDYMLNGLQKTMQLMSNISKMLNALAMGVIRKVG